MSMTVEDLRSLYLGDKPVSEKNLSNLIDYFTDVIFVRGSMKVADLQAKLKSNNTYLYQFSYASEKPTVLRAAMKTTMKGICAIYLFKEIYNIMYMLIIRVVTL